MNTEWYHYFVECTVQTKSEQGGYDGVEIKWQPDGRREKGEREAREGEIRVGFTRGRTGGGESTAFYPVTLPPSLPCEVVIGSATVFSIHRRAFAFACLEVLPGNQNTYVENTNDLVPSVVATKVRFLPYSKHPRTVCMRVEVYGCPRPAGSVTSYSAPKGHEFSPHVFLEDVYDGDDLGARVEGGLGVLVDGAYGGEVVFSDHGIVRGGMGGLWVCSLCSPDWRIFGQPLTCHKATEGQ